MPKQKLKRGQTVTLKSDKSNPKKKGTILSGPPVVFGNPNFLQGIFPIEVNGYVIVKWKGFPDTMEKVSNITTSNRRYVK